MASWYFDSSVLIAAAVEQHVHHSRAASVIETLIAGNHRGYVSAHGLAEVYSALTRTPFRPPIYPGDAMKAIESHILRNLELVSLDGRAYIDTVRTAAEAGWIGGRIHDVIHIRCAVKAKCDLIYTFNLRDFLAIAPEGLAGKITAP